MPISTINQNGLNAPLTLTSPTLSGTTTATTITSPAATALTIQSAGTTAVTINTSQNVGIGTSSPANALNVERNGSCSIRSKSTSSSSAAEVYAVNSASGVVGPTIYGSGVSPYGALGAGEGAFYSNVACTVMSENLLKFAAGGNTERMRIDTSGNVLVNTTSSTGHKMTVQSAAGAGGIDCVGGATNGYYAMRVDMPSTNTYGVLFRNNGNNVGDIRINSSSTTYNTSSDYRLKENIAPMTGALAKVAQLKPCTYTWKVDGSDGQGFIAHELQAVVPDCVSGEKDAIDNEGNPKYQGVDTSFLVATLTAAIQELKAEFDAYKASHP